MTLGLALGSGGARGFCHIGVLRGMEQAGYAPDMVAGCSMGALVGAAWAAGQLEALENWARNLTKARFLSYLDVRFTGGGVLRGQAILDVLSELDLPENIEDLSKPFVTVATDLSTGREVWFQEGSLRDAVRASVAIPGVLRPHKVGDRYLIDGGVTNPVPVSACRAIGAQRIIGVDPNDKAGRHYWQPRRNGLLAEVMGTDLRDKLPDAVSALLPDNDLSGPDLMDVIDSTVEIATDYLVKTREAADPPHLMLRADLSHISVLELFRASEAIEEGARLVENAAQPLDSLLG